MSAYFDYNATTPVPEIVKERLRELYNQNLMNPASVHQQGRKARLVLEKAREKMAHYLGCDRDELVFTSGASEGNQAALTTLYSRAGEQVAILPVEHSSINSVLEGFQSSSIYYLPVSIDGAVDVTCLEDDLQKKKIKGVSTMFAHNETGTLFSLNQLQELCCKYQVLLHTDMACAIGKTPFLFKENHFNYVTASAHKFYGPKGIGFAIVKEKSPWVPVVKGGGQERGLRGGTVPVELVDAMAVALEYALTNLSVETDRQWKLRKLLQQKLLEIDSEIIFNEASEQRQLPGTLSVTFKKIPGTALLAAFDLEGVQVSYGSACQSGSLEVSKALLQFGMSRLLAESTLRFSFGRLTTEEDVEQVIKAYKKIRR